MIMGDVIKFQPKWVRALIPLIEKINAVPQDVWDRIADEQLTELRNHDVHTLRYMWDNIGDNSFYEGKEGKFDCQFIHQVLNEKGDGYYCAV